MSSQLLRLNAFRGEPASSGFEWHFTPNHNSSADSSTSVGTRSEPRAPPTAWELTVSCSISLPDGGSFHPSLTVVSLACPWIQQQFERLTYSGISGSMLIFNSPKHFVAYYALPRLWVPRYPP
ncbi:hypothetical protein L1887_60528 [Cichorium endivia]|nr:hypothetical protein L1887_60528 [Cichorium endivia]